MSQLNDDICEPCRVAFIIPTFGSEWLGGVNYFRNLFAAMLKTDGPANLQPVIFTGTQAKNLALDSFAGIEIVRTHLVDPGSIHQILGKSLQRTIGQNRLLETLLRKYQIKLVSHSGHLGWRSEFPTIAWIPDFQHRHLPDLFTENDLAERNRRFGRLARWCTTVVVSSQQAHNDARAFLAKRTAAIEILRFASAVADDKGVLSLEELRQTFGFGGNYFLLPNQFYSHKNHLVVVKAIKELYERQTPVLVLATGKTNDPRAPDHFESLMQISRQYGVCKFFRPLGIVDDLTLRSLMEHCIAIVNPSLFEGWSTSVEEGKALGKTVVMSDIAVHREQSPKRGIYFEPSDHIELASVLRQLNDRFDVAAEIIERKNSPSEQERRLINFGSDYKTIVYRTIQRHLDNNRGTVWN